jgi:hypothetical protein
MARTSTMAVVLDVDFQNSLFNPGIAPVQKMNSTRILTRKLDSNPSAANSFMKEESCLPLTPKKTPKRNISWQGDQPPLDTSPLKEIFVLHHVPQPCLLTHAFKAPSRDTKLGTWRKSQRTTFNFHGQTMFLMITGKKRNSRTCKIIYFLHSFFEKNFNWIIDNRIQQLNVLQTKLFCSKHTADGV